ncbi:MAG TPA: alpha/beta hydrolase [Hymenobacter sp.]|jgi:predicted dienelactone hydrolase|uniref:alpha/beta hydrolase n=1 Tax=Hymenobacter sp. TaxID=1898978 RepID=UPI002EDB6F9D
MTKTPFLCLALLLAGCATNRAAEQNAASLPPAGATFRLPPTHRLDLFDAARRRAIPVALYAPTKPARASKRKLALFSHGYGGQHIGYSFVARTLAAHGYLVASVQHELPTDEPLPQTGNPREVRRPNWNRGVQNLAFVRRELLRTHPELDSLHLLVAGHSNGGDMSVLFAEQHPQLVEKLISLDHRRMPLARARTPQVLSIRSSDQVADPGVLPTPDEQAAQGMKIVQLPATIHNDMWDGGTPQQRQEIEDHISRFLGN